MNTLYILGVRLSSQFSFKVNVMLPSEGQFEYIYRMNLLLQKHIFQSDIPKKFSESNKKLC